MVTQSAIPTATIECPLRFWLDLTQVLRYEPRSPIPDTLEAIAEHLLRITGQG